MTDATTPAWHPDPTGRHAQRWFDGTVWTEHVADVHGTTSTDPIGSGAPTQAVEAPAGAEQGTDPTAVVETGAQTDPTAAYTAPVADTPAPEGTAPWGQPAPAPGPPPETAAPWGQPAPTPAPNPWEQQAPAQAGWGTPAAPPTGWGAPQPQAGGAYPAPGQPAYGAPAGYPAAPGATGAFQPAALVIVLVGAIAAIVGMFFLNWLSPGGHSKISEIHRDTKGYTDITFMTRSFAAWGAYVALGVGVAAALFGVFVKAFKPIALLLAVAAAGWCLWFAFDLVHWAKTDFGVSGSVAAGAYVAAAGFLVAGVGAVMPHKHS
jgi:hypothetical protein